MYTNTTLKAQLFDTLRRLWIEHVLWTRAFIVSTAANLPHLKAVTDRLLRNPSDFADALRPLYGDRSPAISRSCSVNISV